MGIELSAIAATIPAHFERAARLHPDNIAVRCRLGSISYRELDEAADRLADRLLRTGRPGDRVALLMPQDRRIFIAMVAALKAGRIVFVLNGRDPPARLRQLISDGDPGHILTVDAHGALAAELAEPGVEVLGLDQPFPSDGIVRPRPEIDPYDTAFLVYTSGSTGQPKGVMQTHGHTLRDVLDLTRTCGIVPEDRILLLASLWGAQAVNTTWNALANGATLMSFPAVENGVAGLSDWLVAERVTFFIAASSLFRTFVRSVAPGARFPDIRLIKLSADAATREDFEAYRRHFPNADLINAMGCSETGHLVTLRLTHESEVREGRLPVGRPFSDVGFALIDEDGAEVAPGAVGAISARIRHMAAGYWRDAEMTARHFSVEPDGMRVFRSADVASIDGDGNVVFAGRKDATYKIRGQRVDLAEVEQGVAALKGVMDAAVVAAPRPNGDLELVAFVVPAAGFALSPRKLRAEARAVMPRSFVPASFVILDTLPRAGNGKVDRGQLRAAVPTHVGTSPEVPATPAETMLAGLWAEAFDVPVVGREDDFFDLGGDSLIATMIAARLYAARAATIDFVAFVERPVLKDFAAWLESRAEARADDGPPIVPARRARSAPMSYLQDDFWIDSHLPRSGPRHTRAAVGRIEGPLDLALFKRSLDDVVARHAILRTGFRRRHDRVRTLRRLLGLRRPRTRLIAHPPAPVDLPLVDLTGLPLAEAEKEAASILDEAGHHVFHLSEAPPVFFKLLRLRPDLHHFIQASHHIITDGPSWRVFAADLAAFYEHHSGQGPAPDPLPLQFSDYARWEAERWRRGAPRLVENVAWWRAELAGLAKPPQDGWLSLPSRSPNRKLTPADWSIPWSLDQETLGRLDDLARATASTFFTVRLAAVAVVLCAAIGEERVILSAASTQRTRVELDGQFGPFANVIPLLITCRPADTFRDVILDTRHHLLENSRRVEIPSALLREELRDTRERAAIVPTFWVHMPTPVPPIEFAGLRMSWANTSWYPRQRVTTFLFDPVRGGAGDRLDFNPATHSADQMRALVAGLAEFMRKAAVNPDATLSELLGGGLRDRLRAIGEAPGKA
ncbi:MAG: AMP-binding protein [Bauldia sp.]|nr:AMP-binding protein [Bauldia sp.]